MNSYTAYCLAMTSSCLLSLPVTCKTLPLSYAQLTRMEAVSVCLWCVSVCPSAAVHALMLGGRVAEEGGAVLSVSS